MNKPLSISAQKVQNELKALGYDFEVIESDKETRTAQEAADAAGCSLGQIVKSLVFKGSISEKPVLVLTSGANRVDEKLISAYVGEKIIRADPEFVRYVTGFAIGGIPPIAHAQKLETYLDEDLLGFASIWAAAGTPKAIFELTPAALIAMTGGRAVQVK
jgi:prolyl-tRNA editing enzyme YbaK/EbsC (Cys-tRNA(Pro) deacylase)